jgi:seryl-tRNA synthetase
MLQLALVRQQPDFVKERLRVKNFDASAAIDSILLLDEKRRKLQLELESAQA